GESSLWPRMAPYLYGAIRAGTSLHPSHPADAWSRDRPIDLHVRGRDRDRSVQRSPSLERLHQRSGLILVHASQREPQANPIEDSQVGPYRVRTVDHAFDLDLDA